MPTDLIEVIDSIADAVAVIDGSGRIVHVNRAWSELSLSNGLVPGQPAPRTGVGTNYLEICREALQAGAEDCQAVMEGIEAVLRGRSATFEHDYPCHSAQRQRWYSMRVTPLGQPGRGAVLTHIDVTLISGRVDALAESRQLFAQFMDHLPAAAFIKSEQGRTLYVNRYLAEIIGQRSWLGKSTQELFPIEIARQMIEDDLRALGGGPVVVEEQVPDDEGCVRTFQTHKFRIHRPGQGPLLGAISLDITERKRMDDALRASEAKYRALIETTATGYLIIDGQGRVVDANLEYVRLAGYRTLDEILGRPVTDWTAPAERQRNEDAVAQCARQGYIRNLMMDYLGADGRTTTVEINATVVGAGDELRIVSLCRDVTERRQIEEQVRQLAFYDALTQLPNRRLLYDRLSQALSASKRSGRWGALMVFDLDHFKELNDRHSHSVGDLWLVEVAQRVRRCVREMDTVARFGGDEFVVVLGELDADAELAAKAAAVVAEKIRTALAQPFAPAALPTAALAAPIECHCTASLGVAMFIDDRASQDEIFRCADLAMYHAKDAGRDRIWFHATEG